MSKETPRHRELVALFAASLEEAGFRTEAEPAEDRDWMTWSWMKDELSPLVQKLELLVKKPELDSALANQTVFLRSNGSEILVDGRTLADLGASSGQIELRNGIAGSLGWRFTRRRIVTGLNEALSWFQLFASIPLCIERIESGQSNIGTGAAAERVLRLLRERQTS